MISKRPVAGGQTHLDDHQALGAVVGQHGAVGDGAAAQDRLELAPDDLLSVLLLLRLGVGRPVAEQALAAHLGPERGLALVDPADLVALCEEFADPELEARARDADHGHLDAAGDLEIELLMADKGVLFVELYIPRRAQSVMLASARISCGVHVPENFPFWKNRTQSACFDLIRQNCSSNGVISCQSAGEM